MPAVVPITLMVAALIFGTNSLVWSGVRAKWYGAVPTLMVELTAPVEVLMTETVLLSKLGM